MRALARILSWLAWLWPLAAPAMAADSPQPPPAAAVKPHWAYVEPIRPALPKVEQSHWVRNPIDAFILARLEQEKLRPSTEADAATLIRRLSLDLIGLPPTLAEVDAFVADTSPEACERMVDRLLASPHFGERWARPWLDLARYADSHGYEKDPPRSMWPYRDWVIKAFNRNLPFAQFTLEQIAGDMLPEATEDQKIASGFHRNTMINTEGGVDAEQSRVETIVDRVNTTATVWLGSTLACAQCHNHKYDPFTQKEYYQFFAFFNNADEPALKLASAAQLACEKQLSADVARLEAELKTRAGTPELKAVREQLAESRKAAEALEKEIPTTLVMQERSQPRETHVLVRGNFLGIVALSAGLVSASRRRI